jgi:uncharacterized metal-binding protein
VLENKTKQKMGKNSKPIVYSCHGCCNLAQMAHNVSLNLDDDGIAEMSCVSGIVGKVIPIMELAYSGRPLIVIDGCNLSCTKLCLQVGNLQPDFYYQISDLGFERHVKCDDSLTENAIAIKSIYDQLYKEGIGF